MWWFEQKPDSPAGMRREIKRLRQLATEQAAEIQRLKQDAAIQNLAYERDSLAKERDLQEAHSTIHIQQVELRQQAGVIERDRQRVQAELSEHIARAAVASHLKHLRGGNGQVLHADKDSSGG